MWSLIHRQSKAELVCISNFPERNNFSNILYSSHFHLSSDCECLLCGWKSCLANLLYSLSQLQRKQNADFLLLQVLRAHKAGQLGWEEVEVLHKKADGASWRRRDLAQSAAVKVKVDVLGSWQSRSTFLDPRQGSARTPDHEDVQSGSLHRSHSSFHTAGEILPSCTHVFYGISFWMRKLKIANLVTEPVLSLMSCWLTVFLTGGCDTVTGSVE